MYVFLIHDDIHLLYQKEYMRYGEVLFSQAIMDFSLSGDQYHHLACGGNRKNQKLEQYLENDRKAGNTLEKHFDISLGEVISSFHHLLFCLHLHH